MAEPVLRIPVDDAAFKRYIDAFKKYQTQLEQQPGMWNNTNEAILDAVNAGSAFADTIQRSIDNTQRLGNVEDRNRRERRRDAQETEQEAKRQSSWRQQALSHVQELSRTSSSIVRGLGNLGAGGGRKGGIFKLVEGMGLEGLGGIGAVVGGVAAAAFANYKMNDTLSDKGQAAIGMGASLSNQQGFKNNLGRFVDTDQGIDAVMNARGDARQWAPFATLGVKDFRGPSSNSQIYAEVLQKQVELARKNTKNGITNWNMVDPLGGTAFGTTHEDINRLMKAPDLKDAISKSLNFKSAAGDKEIESATKAAAATDTFTTRIEDGILALNTKFNPAIGSATDALDKLTSKIMGLVGMIPDISMPSTSDIMSAGANPGAAIGGGIGGWLAGKVSSWWNSDKAAPAGTGAGAGSGAALMARLNKSDAVGRSAANTALSSGATGRGAQITAALIANGIDPMHATAATAGIYGENSSFDPNAVNKSSGAYGLGQWLGKRKSGLFAMAKADHVSPSSIQEQMKYLAWELKGGDFGGKSVLTADSLAKALWAYADHFMRPDKKGMGHAQAQGDVNRGAHYLAKIKVKVEDHTGNSPVVTANSVAKT